MASFYFCSQEKPRARGRGKTVDLAAAAVQGHNIITNSECDAMDDALFRNLSATKSQAISRNKAKQARAFESIGHYDVVGVFDRKRRFPERGTHADSAPPYAVSGLSAAPVVGADAAAKAARRTTRPSWAEPRPGGIFC
mmetsp:Transcript_28272/g.50865  ORF Transcript_28272/g.50865 Transcript_28272/m.50865 type:complete len:139 (-) Transcript_28272:315-731(-)